MRLSYLELFSARKYKRTLPVFRLQGKQKTMPNRKLPPISTKSQEEDTTDDVSETTRRKKKKQTGTQGSSGRSPRRKTPKSGRQSFEIIGHIWKLLQWPVSERNSAPSAAC